VENQKRHDKAAQKASPHTESL